MLSHCHGILVPHGFGSRGVEGKIAAVKYAREERVPYFGICYGMQLAVVELARNVAELEGANSTEVDPDTPHPVICLMESQEDVAEKGGTMRLGAWPCVVRPGTKIHDAYDRTEVSERHRHRLEFNPVYHDVLSRAGLVFSGMSPDGQLVEVIELEDHPWFVGTQYHPEFQSTPFEPHPLFSDFVAAAIELASGK